MTGPKEGLRIKRPIEAKIRVSTRRRDSFDASYLINENRGSLALSDIFGTRACFVNAYDTDTSLMWIFSTVHHI